MPKPYLPTMPTTWWLKKGSYTLFILRELTSVFVGAYCILLLIGLSRLGAGSESWESFLSLMRAPGFVVFHLVALAMALYHTVTFLNLTPKVLVIRLGEEKVPASVIAAAHYIGWLACSAVVAWAILG
jgi:fumarate reductase subunit C